LSVLRSTWSLARNARRSDLVSPGIAVRATDTIRRRSGRRRAKE